MSPFEGEARLISDINEIEEDGEKPGGVDRVHRGSEGTPWVSGMWIRTWVPLQPVYKGNESRGKIELVQVDFHVLGRRSRGRLCEFNILRSLGVDLLENRRGLRF